MTVPESMSLRDAVRELDLSEVWVRRQLRKKIGVLGNSAFKNDEGRWRIPVSVITSECKRLKAKRERTRLRVLGLLPKQSFVYIPDKIKAPKIMKEVLTKRAKEFKLSTPQLAKFTKICDLLISQETAKHKKRQEEKAKKAAKVTKVMKVGVVAAKVVKAAK